MIARPKNFKFKAGDYIRIKIPVISLTEYHPFTISSAPENEGKICYFDYIKPIFNIFVDEIWLHIRKNGDWTDKLHDYFYDLKNLENYSPPLNKFLCCFKQENECEF